MREKNSVVRAYLGVGHSSRPLSPPFRPPNDESHEEGPQDLSFGSFSFPQNHPESTSHAVDDGASPIDLSMKSSTSTSPPQSTSPPSPASAASVPQVRSLKRARLESMVSQICQIRNPNVSPRPEPQQLQGSPEQTVAESEAPDHLSAVSSNSSTSAGGSTGGVSSLGESFRPRANSDGFLVQYMHRRHKALQSRTSKVTLPTLPDPDFSCLVNLPSTSQQVFSTPMTSQSAGPSSSRHHPRKSRKISLREDLMPFREPQPSPPAQSPASSPSIAHTVHHPSPFLESLLQPKPMEFSPPEGLEDRLGGQSILQRILATTSTPGLMFSGNPSDIPAPPPPVVFPHAMAPPPFLHTGLPQQQIPEMDQDMLKNPLFCYAFYSRALQAVWQKQMKLDPQPIPNAQPHAVPSPKVPASPSAPSMSPASTPRTPSPGNLLMASPKKRAPRAMTGKHVRHGTAAKPQTLLKLRAKIQERLSQRMACRPKEPHQQYGIGAAAKKRNTRVI